AVARVYAMDLDLPENVRAGVISSYDTTLETTLQKLAIAHEMLDQPEAFARLAEFTHLLVDMRAYQYRPDLVANNGALLEFVYAGGRLLVLYQKNFDWKPEFAPYPLRVSRNRVTREDAPVRLLVPEHPLFHTPNEIIEEDWNGWVQERGLYFPDEWDAHYTALIDVQDPGEQIPPGALLVTDYGKGKYLYTALALYRQLRELHPGALRLFLNMLAL
ncbi:MAG: hypothetical protein HYZ00_13095, partial [Candidatus Hydrogenedentes bacterium]|nr:hypothetical protein [Candidatus Hydrogenedentota bacterium]